MPAGMACLAIALTIGRFVHPGAARGQHVVDFGEGLFLGLSISLNLVAIAWNANHRKQ